MDLVIKSTKERPLIRLFTPQKISDYLEKSKKEKPLITYENNTNINDNNLQNTYVELDKNYLELFNKYFPLIRQSHKQFKDKPYVTSGIKESIKSRNALYKAYLANPTEDNELIWKQKKIEHWKFLGNLNLIITLPSLITMLIPARCCGKPWETS